MVSDQKKRAKEAGPFRSKALELSQKWKALGVSGDLSSARQMSPVNPCRVISYYIHYLCNSPVYKTKMSVETGRIDSSYHNHNIA